MVGAEAHEAHYGEPDRDDFRDDFAGRDGQVDGHADEPVTCKGRHQLMNEDGRECGGQGDVQRIPLRKIWCHCGVTHLVFAKARASSLYAPVSNVPPSVVC